MRHNVKKTGLRKTKSKAKALRRSLLTALFKHDKIQTTEGRAKTIAPLAEKLITYVRTHDDMQAIRHIDDYILEKDVAKKVMSEVKEKYANQESGYTRIIKLGHRPGDGATKVQIELI